MSRAYRISVAERVARKIVTADEVRSRLELLNILPPEATAGLLRADLTDRGFRENGDGSMSRQSESTTLTIDPCSGEVTVTIEARRNSAAEGGREVTVWDDADANIEAKTRESLRGDLAKKLDRDEAKLQEETTRELVQALTEIQPELGRIANKVTREALKIKAKTLGQVRNVIEDELSGSLTIQVEV